MHPDKNTIDGPTIIINAGLGILIALGAIFGLALTEDATPEGPVAVEVAR